MPITRTVENSLRNVDPTPLYAVVGAGDRLVAKLRDAREEVQARGGVQNADHAWDPRTLSATLQAAAAARVETVTAEVRARTADAKTLPDQATVLLTGAVAQAIMTYAELAHRGKDVVARVRGSQGTPVRPTVTAPTAGTSTSGPSKTGTSTTTGSSDEPSATSTRSASRSTRAAKKSATSTTKRATSSATTRKSSAPAKKTSNKRATKSSPKTGPKTGA
jgi:hypothetical protein